MSLLLEKGLISPPLQSLRCCPRFVQVQVLKFLTTLAQKEDLLHDVMDCRVRATLVAA